MYEADACKMQASAFVVEKLQMQMWQWILQEA